MEEQPDARRIPFATPFGRQIRSPGSARGTALSAVLHVGIIALLLWKTGQQFVDANQGLGDGSGRRGGGGGGGGLRSVAMLLPAAATAQTPQPPAPTPALVVPPTPTTIPEPQPQPAAAEPVAPTPATGAGEGAGTGSGTGPGSGTGSGGGTGGGVGTGVGNDSGPGGGGGSIYQPALQGILIPPTEGRPRELRGVRVKVTFFISERGEVVRVETDPEIRDRGYRNEFMDRMRRYSFTPAMTRDGHPVAAKLDIFITL